jgi:rhodanese-related sulfurtransferase
MSSFAVSACRVDCNQASLLLVDHVYLDVRTSPEFAAGHIDGTSVTNVPVWLKNAEGGFEPNPAFVAEVEQVRAFVPSFARWLIRSLVRSLAHSFARSLAGSFVRRLNCTQALPDKATKIIVACASGKRSAAAVAALEGAGYTSLSDMSDGYMGWCAAGLPTTS